jgi:hypothetical protein
MNDGARDLVSALLARLYAAVILVVGELYIVNSRQSFRQSWWRQAVGLMRHLRRAGSPNRPIRGLRHESDGALR